MNGYYRVKTRAGLFRIVPHQGRWVAMFEDEALGSYISPQQAAEDVAGGHVFWPSCGDTSVFGIPEDVSEWDLVKFRG